MKCSAFPHEGHDHLDLLKRCFSITSACAKICIEAGHKKTALICSDCADIYGLTIKLHCGDSDFGPQMFKLCAEVCRKCAEECARKIKPSIANSAATFVENVQKSVLNNFKEKINMTGKITPVNKEGLKKRMDKKEPLQILNVLHPGGYKLGVIKRSKKPPLTELEQRHEELDKSK
jgi:hypothetical protein